MNDTPQLTYALHPSQPSWTPPPLACDTHVHVFGPAAQFPYAASRNFTPVDAGKQTLYELHKHLGIGRCVIVQTAVHGHDNSVTEDAIAHGGGRYLGIALVPPDVNDTELKRLAAAGFRGVRFNFMPHLSHSIDGPSLIALSQRLANLNLHLQVHFPSGMIHALAPVFEQCATTVVVDHIGRVDAALGAQHADYTALCRLMDQPHLRVKVSGIDRIDPQPPYNDGIPLARHLVERFPTQCVWGTDWPHPNHTHTPDDGELVNSILRIAPTRELQQQLLVDNPQALYAFDHP